MDLGLKGRTALVLGAGGGLGRAIARALAQEGARVAAGDVNADALEQTVREITAAGGEAMAVRWDLADVAAGAAAVSQVEARFGPVGILVNNTGGPPPTPVAGQSPALWTNSFQSMVLSVIALTDRVLPGMREQRWGRIVTSTSSGVVAPIPNLGISNALRVSLVGWSKTLAARGRALRHHGERRRPGPHRDAAHEVPRRGAGAARRQARRAGLRREHRHDPHRPLRHARGVRRRRHVPRERPRVLRHRVRRPHRRRHDPHPLDPEPERCPSIPRSARRCPRSPPRRSRRSC